MQAVSIEVLEMESKLIMYGLLQTSGNASQVICPLVKVSVVEKVFFLEDRFRHPDHHIHRQRKVRFDHCLECITSNNIDMRRFRIC